jgi:hypothetical protein
MQRQIDKSKNDIRENSYLEFHGMSPERIIKNDL